MNNIRTTFSINDLENFTGIKAHTIRVWERRYGIFSPNRTDGNQRLYSLEDLQKILNVKLMYSHGYKISKIASFDLKDIPNLVQGVSRTKWEFDQAIDSFLLAMLNFDQQNFEEAYMRLKESISFRDIFLEVFVPLLEHIGLLWQTNAINPAHEHFISNLVQQKILTNIEIVGRDQILEDERTYVLFLPMNEIHDLGLLFVHYELLSMGRRSIYLGQSVPLESLTHVKPHFSPLTFVSYFTVEPKSDHLSEYLQKAQKTLLIEKEHNMWVLGRKTTAMDIEDLGGRIHPFAGIKDLIDSKYWEGNAI